MNLRSRSSTVGIVVPLYNGAATVGSTLDSLLAQTFEDWCAVVVNDGSTDVGAPIVDRYAARDARIVLVNQSNLGLAGARNRGLDEFDQHARPPEFVHFLDADDVLTPRGLELLVAEARFTGSPAVYGRLELLTEDGRPTRWSPLVDHFNVALPELLKGCVFPVHAQLIQHEALDGQRFGHGLRIAEDWDFWLRLAERGVHWTGFDGLIGGYRMRPAGLSRDALGMFAGLVETVVSAHARCGADSRAVVDELAMEWATAAAATDEPGGPHAGLSILRAAGVLSVDPHTAAIKAFHRMPTALCMTPQAWHDHPNPLAESADTWWLSLVRAGVVPHQFIAIAKQSLAQLMAHPRAVGEHIASQLDPDRPVVLLGMGRNARHIALAAWASRRNGGTSKPQMWGFDDLQISPPRWTRHLGTPVMMVNQLADLPPDAQLVLTPTQDDRLLNRLNTKCGALRWSTASAQVASECNEKLGRAWPEQSHHAASALAGLAPRAKVA